MQQQIVAPREQRPPLVKEQVDQSLLMMAVIVTGAGSLMLWAAAAICLLAGNGWPLVPAIVLTLSFYVQIRAVRFRKRLEQKRQVAAWGEPRLLADEQPAPTAQMLPLPFTMRMRPHWSRLMAVSSGVLLLSAVYWALFFVFAPASSTVLAQHSPVFFWLLVAGSMLIWPIVFFATAYKIARQQVTLTEHGIIQVGVGKDIKSVSWSQIRLFAIVPAPLRRASSPSLSFEVASADETIQWSWVRSSGISRLFFFARPVVSPSEYEQQMRAMLAMIQARTQLPLVDLRKPL